MNSFALFLTFFLFASESFFVQAHVSNAQSGVFQRYQNLQQGKGAAQKRRQSVVFEKKADRSDSKVFDICGMEQFERIVIKNSYYRPVVLKLYLPTHQEIAQINETFQSVSENFNMDVVFAGLNVTKNMELYLKIYSFCNLKDVELPLFLFYEKGQLKMPFLKGFQHKGYLVEYIQNMFFTQNSNEK